MSNPKNILDAYRSYTYNHILAVCDSTSAAEALAQEGDITLFDVEENNLKYQLRTVPGRESQGQYAVVVNSLADATFHISSVNWTTMMIPNPETDGVPSYHTKFLTGEMSIVEPKGVRFLNTLHDISEQMRADPTVMTFLLKTVFTGYRSDGGRDLITTVEPLIFTMYDISADFSITGATYAISFAGAVNGAGSLPKVSSISDGMTFVLEQKNLEGAFTALQEALNDRYQKFKKRAKEQAECSNFDVDFDAEFMDVEYHIELDDAYKGDMSVGDNHKFLQQEFGENDSIVVGEDETMSVENLIESVMRSSKDVITMDNPERAADFVGDSWIRPAGPGSQGAAFTQQQRNEEEREQIREDTENEPKHMFMINTTVNSDNEKYVVTYHINRHYIPINKQNDRGETQFIAPNPGQGIEFDYIFTGKNVDILDYQLSMKMGMSFFMLLRRTESLPNAEQLVAYDFDQSVQPGSGELNSLQTSRPDRQEKAKKPLFLGQSVKDSLHKNKEFPRYMISYNTLLSRHAGRESVEQSITIRGNPQLLAESSPVPSRLIRNEAVPVVLTEESNTQESQEPNTIIPRMWKQPGFARVNVKMPALNDNDPDYAEEFWYRGWFTIRQIDNSFEDGKFEQTILMNAIQTEVPGRTGSGREECEPISDETTTSSRPLSERLPPGARRTAAEQAEESSNYKDERSAKESVVEISDEARAKQRGPGAGR